MSSISTQNLGLGPQFPPQSTFPPFLNNDNVATTLSPINRWEATASIVEIPTLNWRPTTSATGTAPTIIVGTVETQRVPRDEKGRGGSFDEVVVADAERAARLVGNEAFVTVKFEPRKAVEVGKGDIQREGDNDVSDMIGNQDWKSFDALAAAASLSPGPVAAGEKELSTEEERSEEEIAADESSDGASRT